MEPENDWKTESLSTNLGGLLVKFEVRYKQSDYDFHGLQLADLFLNQVVAFCQRCRIEKDEELDGPVPDPVGNNEQARE